MSTPQTLKVKLIQEKFEKRDKSCDKSFDESGSDQ
jgi:hypothetical protein